MTTRILIAGFQHETNTFAPTQADWAAFQRGETFPGYVHGAAMVRRFANANIPVGGFIQGARQRGWTLLPSCWAGATPSAHVTRDAFERMAAVILGCLRQAIEQGGVDAVYLDLHGAAVAEHLDDVEGELLAQVRAALGPDVPVVASLDMHANVTARMLETADALVAYRTYPGGMGLRRSGRRRRGGSAPALRAHRLAALAMAARPARTARCRGPRDRHRVIRIGPVEIEGVLVAVACAKTQMLDRELFRHLGIEPERMKLLVNKSSVHFRADFAPIAQAILVAKAAGPMAADPADLPWRKLPAAMARRP